MVQFDFCRWFVLSSPSYSSIRLALLRSNPRLSLRPCVPAYLRASTHPTSISSITGIISIRQPCDLRHVDIMATMTATTSSTTTTTEMKPFYSPTATMHMSHAPAASAMDELLAKYSSPLRASSSNSLRKKSFNPVQRVIDRVRLEYYRYEVTFGLYVMTPTEKCVANTFVLIVLSLLLWALLLYFPSLLFHKLARLVWLVTGQTGEVSTTLGMRDMHGNPITATFAAEAPLPS